VQKHLNAHEPAMMGQFPFKGYWSFDNRIDADHRRMDGRGNQELSFYMVNQKILFPLSNVRGVLEPSFFEEEEAAYDDQ
jgi:hypothetical protein